MQKIKKYNSYKELKKNELKKSSIIVPAYNINDIKDFANRITIVKNAK